MAKHKIFEIKVLDHRKDGGRIVISTGSVDRDKDRVFPQGAKVENFLKNPVVLWGHNYFDAAALIGRANSVEINETGIVADFTLRAAASDSDPQNIVLLLWEKEFVRASSIGFMPDSAGMVPNDFGGMDFVSWELLEFSLVSVPANADALRLAAKTYPKAWEAYQKRGRVLSAANEKKIKDARDNLDQVLAQLADEDEDDDGKSFVARHKRAKAEAFEPGSALAWVRRMEAISDLGTQQLYAVFRQYTIDIPKDATTLRCDDQGNIIEVPDPNAGKSITRKEVVFVPPIAYEDEDWGEDATYSISASEREDADLVKSMGGNWEVTYLSEPIDSIAVTKSARRRRVVSLGLRSLTQRGYEHAKAIIRRKAAKAAPVAGISDEEGAAILAQLSAIKQHAVR